MRGQYFYITEVHFLAVTMRANNFEHTGELRSFNMPIDK